MPWMDRRGGQNPRRGALGVLAVLLVALVVTALDGTLRKGSSDKHAGNPGTLRVSTAPGPSGDRTPVPGLLPNVQVLPASNPLVDTAGPGRRLRFDSTLVNTGPGPFEVVPDPLTRCPPRQRHVSQVVYRDADGDGRYDREVDRTRVVVAAGCMLFHPGHDHWHVDATAAYRLTPSGSAEPLAERAKVSFCLRDSDRLRAGEGDRKRYGECARDRRQGISVGWTDLYDNTLEGQTLRLPPDLGDGDYCLRLRADPFDLFRESDEQDNESAVVVRLRGNRATLPPVACAA